MSVKVPLLTWLRQIWNMLEKCLNNTLCCTRSLEFAETVCCQLVTVSQTLPWPLKNTCNLTQPVEKKNSTSTHAQRVVLVGLLIQWISVLWSSTAGQLLEVPIWINPLPHLSCQIYPVNSWRSNKGFTYFPSIYDGRWCSDIKTY